MLKFSYKRSSVHVILSGADSSILRGIIGIATVIAFFGFVFGIYMIAIFSFGL